MGQASIILNGSRHPIEPGQSISTLLACIGLAGRPVVVELNETAILPALLQSTCLKDGDKLEIVSIAAGG